MVAERDWVGIDISEVDEKTRDWLKAQAGARGVRLGEIVNRLVELAVDAKQNAVEPALMDALRSADLAPLDL